MSHETSWVPTAPMGSDNHRTLAEWAFNELRAAIVSGELAPGSRLLIGDLAGALGVSPMPVREAVRRLEALGLAEHIPHRGARVSSRNGTDLVDLVRARLAVEPAATELAASVFTDKDRVRAQNALDEYHETAQRGDVAAVSKADQAFHFTIYEAAGSPWLLRLIRPLWESAEVYRRSGTPSKYGFDERETEHTLILEACAKHEPAEAHERMARHLQQSANRISRALMGAIVFPQVLQSDMHE